jgi:hypothetical protein
MPAVRLGAVAAAGDDQRQRALGICQAEMQRREAAHREADDMRPGDGEPIQHRADVVARAVLGISLRLGRHIRGRIAAGVEGDAAVEPREMAQLRLPAPMIAGEFVDKNDQPAGAGLFVIQTDAVVRGRIRHVRLQWLSR